MNGKNLLLIYATLRSNFGFQNWWPAETNDEMAIGAILTQNTSWKNVEKAIKSLRESGLLSLKNLSKASIAKIRKSVRSSGFYKQKAERLKLFSSYIVLNYGSLEKFFKKSKRPREELLSIKGIGKETADSMLLYAGKMPYFIIDTYTVRVFSRVFGIKEGLAYDKLQEKVHNLLAGNVPLYQDFHAQIVELAKRFCKKKPLCTACPLAKFCAYKAKS